ncbi:nucleotidyltransferase [Pseudonocardia sp. KRD291]|uniref:nucleotidyltransferase n=1 Tax=Pseudonocardia sp. KRD291 TaxID=2792007 RepID=UPI001C4A6580|nr:nucleotidyltransferase [Pseudonocardia sp. KRD291]MBW0102668.1 nucleotidyltransferase [Pseudonocardia sp. KRD291]
MADRGLAPDGTIAREGSLDHVPAQFAPVVEAARAHITRWFGSARLHSAYLYGSIPRGTAVPGVSDLDVLLALHDDPTDADRTEATAVETALDVAFPQIDGVGVLLSGKGALLSDLERHDLGFFVACLCTPLIGHDLARDLPRYRPTSLLARETNGDLSTALERWRVRAAHASTQSDLKALNRSVARRIVRTGLTLVMPWWGGWTSDLVRSAELFGGYYPERSRQMRAAAAEAGAPTADPVVRAMLLDDLGPWLASEYAAVHGVKTAR